MYISDKEINEIIRKLCGDPADIDKLRAFIALNQHKLDFYTKNPLYLGKSRAEKEKYHEDQLDSYKRMIQIANENIREATNARMKNE